MTQDRRMTLTVAAAVVLTSTVLFPAFLGSTWFYYGIGAVLAVAGAGALSRLRTLPVAVNLLISLIGLVLYLNLVFEASRSIIYIIPSSASMTGLWHVAHTGFHNASQYAAPAPSTAGLELLATAGIGITAVVTDLIAVRLRSAALAGLPLLVLFTVPVSLNANRSPLSVIVIFALATSGYLALLSADGRERIRVWGRLISLWRTYEGEPKDAGPAATATAQDASGTSARSPYQVLRGPDTRSLAAAGRRVGIASIVLALCTPLLIPGLHAAKLASSDWVFGTGSSNGPGLYDPLVAAQQDLKEKQPYTILTYTTTASAYLQKKYPQYLQQYVFSTLTDTDGWLLPFSTTIKTYPFNTQLPPQTPQISNAGAPQVQTVVSISKSASLANSPINLLPAPYPPEEVYISSGSWEDDPSTLMIVTENTSLDGLDYRVVSRDPDPPSTTLGAVPAPPAMPADTQLPVSYRESAKLRNLALKLTDGYTTEYGKAYAITKWLSQTGGFTYDVYAPPIEDVSDLVTYLTKSKIGDCVQSSFADTVLLRLLGIPARLAVGFTQGAPSGRQAPGATYVVKSSDAHAWPEVFFSGYGWMRFEPTPPGGAGTATAPGYADPPTTGGTQTVPVGGQTSTPTSGGKSKVLGDGRLKGENGGGIIPTGSIPTITKATPSTPWPALVLAVLAALALACGVIAALAPAGHRALAARQITGPRRVSLSTALAVLTVAGVIALALYRVLSHTKGLNLGSSWATIGIAFGIACAVALAVPISCRFVARRWRWIRAGENDADLAHAAWEELRADLADYGIGYLPSESPRALAGRVTSDLVLAEPAVEAVNRIALAEERATYAARPSDAEGLRRDGATARRAVAAATGRSARWRARLFPASTMAAIADMAARIPEAWATRGRLRLFGRRRDIRLDG
jgi:transglutaminase-like putative cysteine protease